MYLWMPSNKQYVLISNCIIIRPYFLGLNYKHKIDPVKIYSVSSTDNVILPNFVKRTNILSVFPYVS